MPAGFGALANRAVYPTHRQLPLTVRRLVDFLAEALREPPWLTQAG